MKINSRLAHVDRDVTRYLQTIAPATHARMRAHAPWSSQAPRRSRRPECPRPPSSRSSMQTFGGLLTYLQKPVHEHRRPFRGNRWVFLVDEIQPPGKPGIETHLCFSVDGCEIQMEPHTMEPHTGTPYVPNIFSLEAWGAKFWAYSFNLRGLRADT